MLKPLSFCILLSGLLLVSCNNTEEPTPACPVNKDNAKKNVISASQGTKWIDSYRSVSDTLKLNQMELVNYETFNRDAIQLLLNVKGAEGIRISMGRNDANEVVTILAPVDKDGKVILTELIGTTEGAPNARDFADSSKAQFIEEGVRCPRLCN